MKEKKLQELEEKIDDSVVFKDFVDDDASEGNYLSKDETSVQNEQKKTGSNEVEDENGEKQEEFSVLKMNDIEEILSNEKKLKTENLATEQNKTKPSKKNKTVENKETSADKDKDKKLKDSDFQKWLATVLSDDEADDDFEDILNDEDDDAEIGESCKDDDEAKNVFENEKSGNLNESNNAEKENLAGEQFNIRDYVKTRNAQYVDQLKDNTYMSDKEKDDLLTRKYTSGLSEYDKRQISDIETKQDNKQDEIIKQTQKINDEDDEFDFDFDINPSVEPVKQKNKKGLFNKIRENAKDKKLFAGYSKKFLIFFIALSSVLVGGLILLFGIIFNWFNLGL